MRSQNIVARGERCKSYNLMWSSCKIRLLCVIPCGRMMQSRNTLVDAGATPPAVVDTCEWVTMPNLVVLRQTVWT